MNSVPQIQARPIPELFRRTVSQRAVALWKASHYDATLDALLDLSGNGLHARLGSAVGPDTNDPLRLQFSGEKELYFPGIAGNYLRSTITPLTGIVQVVFRNNGWIKAPSGAGLMIGDRGVNTGWSFYSNGGVLYFQVNVAGQALAQPNISIAAAAVSARWIKLIGNPNSSGTCRLTIYYSDDGVNWTSAGTATAGVGGTINPSAGVMWVGGIPNVGSLSNGRTAYVEISDGENGPVVAAIKASELSEPYASYADPQGNVWTLNRSTSGRKLSVVDLDMLMLGTDDFLRVAYSPLFASAPLTAIGLFRHYGNFSGFERFFDTINAGVPGFRLYGNTASAGILADTVKNGGGLISNSGLVLSSGAATLVGLHISNTGARISVDGTISPHVAGVPDLSGGGDLYIGVQNANNQFLQGEFLGGGLFRESLSVGDCLRFKKELLT